MLKVYQNEPFVDFSSSANQQLMQQGLDKVQLQKGQKYPLVIDGEKIFTEEEILSVNPANPEDVIGIVSSASLELAEKAVAAAEKAFSSWKKVPADERANYLFNAAAIIRRRKFEFSGWLIEEAGKTWREADADTAEAIDFLEYYGRQMLKLKDGAELTPYPGENNECPYIPLGIAVVIAPWNFPLAILAGMTAAAVVTGNTVIMKPASTTAVVAAKLMEVFEEIGLPKGVINYLPGPGGQIGDYLVSHAKVRFINFTGSKEVGLRINKLAADIAPGQKWIKRVVAEMGGKDTIVVDEEANLDEAAAGIVASAFGFQGQKCSACSRAIIAEAVYDKTIEKVVALAKTLKMGMPREMSTDLGPVIDHKAQEKIQSYIEIGKTEGKLVLGGQKNERKGYFVEPTIFVDVAPKARIAQEEIFGPVLAVIKAKTFDEALEIANNTEYGLTGAVYTSNRTKIEQTKKEFFVGNLYINRKCTGALVGVNPFGGFNMSGTDSKAGGPDYLQLFMQLKSITERF